MPKAPKYHHGDLRNVLLEKANELLRENGIGGLTLRGLAERAGVSRQAPYHYFSSKQALLCALAEEAFADLDKVFVRVMNEGEQSVDERFKQFVTDYVTYAIDNPEKYELMFGPVIWKQDPTPELIEKGHSSFQNYAMIIKTMQEQGELPTSIDALRLAQATWATMHGLCRLKNDGIFASMDSVEEISLYAVNMMMSVLSSAK